MNIIKKLIGSALALVFAVSIFPVSANALGTATLSMVPSNSSINTGDSVNVAIYENGTNVSVVTVQISYDAAKLNCNGVNVSGSAFANAISASCASGTATISRYINPGSAGLSGSQFVATLQFTASTEGSASINFGSGSQIASEGTNIWNGSTLGTTINITQPKPADNNSGTNNGGTSTGGSTTTNNTQQNNSTSSVNNTSTKKPNATTTVSSNSQTSADQQENNTNSNSENSNNVLGESTQVSAQSNNDSPKNENTTKSNLWLWALTLVLVILGGIYFFNNSGSKKSQNK